MTTTAERDRLRRVLADVRAGLAELADLAEHARDTAHQRGDTRQADAALRAHLRYRDALHHIGGQHRHDDQEDTPDA